MSKEDVKPTETKVTSVEAKLVVAKASEADSNPWGNVIKKRSRLEMEQERAKAACQAEDGEDDVDAN